MYLENPRAIILKRICQTRVNFTTYEFWVTRDNHLMKNLLGGGLVDLPLAHPRYDLHVVQWRVKILQEIQTKYTFFSLWLFINVFTISTMPIAYIGTTSCPENSLSNKHIGGMFTSTFQLHLQPRFTQQLTEQKYSFTVATEA